ncbi:MAG: phospholipase D family protein [Bacteroidetes bacterium]|nr:phospholipase D family protein [Bacteroidota bacterium]
MKLIITSAELSTTFISLLNKYKEYYFATAWAGIPERIFDKLSDNNERIKKMAVGIHFYQTDPVFFERFEGNNSVRAILQPDGTFHPKVFLFYNSNNDWTLLIGSGNFTNAAFSKNAEAMLMISSSEATDTILANAKKIVIESWAHGKKLDDAFVKSYRLQWHNLRRKRKELEKEISNHSILTTGASAFMQESWGEYVARYNQKREIVNKRFEMLESIRNIFASGRSLVAMTEGERRFIAGNPNDLDLPGADRYADFGTSGNGQFMKKMIEGNIHFSSALDKIPLIGDITEDNYNNFLALFLGDPDTTVGWVSSAARLLAMKRPDTFYNITSGNRIGFCEDFDNVRAHTHSLHNYWSLVVEKVQLSKWYNVPQPSNRFEKKLWETRAAMLDVLYYDGF